MRKIFLTFFLAFFFFQGIGQTKNYIDQPYLEMRVKVDTLVSPDKISFSIIISEKDSKDKKSVEELENKMAAKLKSLGIKLEDQLKLSDFSSNYKHYLLKQQDILKSKTFILTVYDALTVGKVIISLEEIGISNIKIKHLEYSKPDELKLILKSKAIIKAKHQGETMLKLVNQNLGAIIFLSDTNSYISSALQNQNSGIQVKYNSNKKKESKPLDIEFDKIKIQSEIYVKFKIE